MRHTLLNRMLLWCLASGMVSMHGLAQQHKPPGMGEQSWQKEVSKLSPHFASKIAGNNQKQFTVRVQVKSVASFQKWASGNPILTIKSVDEYWRVTTIATNAAGIRLLLEQPMVEYIQDGDRKVTTELSVPGFEPSSGAVALSSNRFPNLTGRSIVLSIKEARFDTTDIDFRKRFFTTSYTAKNTTNHATIMASMMAGSGNSSGTGKGTANQSLLTSASFENLLPEPNNYFSDNAISIQNHSYGVGIENEYGIDGAAYDASTYTQPVVLHVFSAGNAGNQTATSGTYQNLPGWANLTGSFKMSKNSLSVAAIDSFNRTETLGSKGPAYDGRLKPELAAFGEDGTSGAAALVSGAAALIQQQIKQQTGKLPEASLIKSILINGSDDVGTEGPDFKTGYGHLNVYRSLQIAAEKKYLTDTVVATSNYTFFIQIPANSSRLKATLCWTEAAAAPNAGKALLHDLNIKIVTPSNDTLLPWILNAFPHPDSLSKQAIRGMDTLNVVEQISMLNPIAGNYKIIIQSPATLTQPQPFSVAWQTIEKNTVLFTHPTSIHHADAREGIVIRWMQGFDDDAKGSLSIHNLSANSTEVLSSNFPLNQQYLLWKPTNDQSYLAMLKMNVNQRDFYSDTFLVHAAVQPRVGYVCGDSIQLYWQGINRASSYRIYHLADTLLQAIATVTDTTFKTSIKNLQTTWFAVAPMIAGREGKKSSSFNVLSQGVGCYISSFLARLVNNNASLQVSLGTNYNIQKLIFQKITATQITDLEIFTNITGTQLTTTDATLVTGENRYRVKLELKDGSIIYSNMETLYFAGPSLYTVYPIPVKRGQPLNVISAYEEPAVAEMYDMVGRKISTTIIDGLLSSISTNYLPAGMYVLKVLTNQKTWLVQKIVVL